MRTRCLQECLQDAYKMRTRCLSENVPVFVCQSIRLRETDKAKRRAYSWFDIWKQNWKQTVGVWKQTVWMLWEVVGSSTRQETLVLLLDRCYGFGYVIETHFL